MSKAKTASKNNPTARESAKVHFYKGEEIIPSKYIPQQGSSFLAAEIKSSGDLVVGTNGQVLPWNLVKNLI